MADYIYLLENRLSGAQQRALLAVRQVAREKGLTVFLVGGAVRDLTSGSPVRDLDVVVQGNAFKLKRDIENAGAFVTGEVEARQALFVRFPGGVRMEVGSTLSVSYPKPGKPVATAATILEDLRRRDFTANAMALSLNDGSYGLLMDPMNGVADIENRELRLVSNYGFIEDPVRMVRAARYAARLGWQMEEKTQARYETGKAEGYISGMQEFPRGYELEEIVHEEDPLRVLRRLEQEGWMAHLAPAWSAAKANVPELEKLREAQMQLQMQGIHTNAPAAQFLLLTAKVAAKDVAELKKSFPRKGFVAEIEALEADAKKFAAELGSKQAATASATWKMLTVARPEVVLWVAYSTKSAALQAKFKSFYTEWPQARQKIPYTLMQEMRIVPELAGYTELVETLFFELMDGKLGTVEEMKAFLEPHSPPAPPPPVNLRRSKAAKKDTKAAKSRKKAEAAEAEAQDGEVLPAVAEASTGGEGVPPVASNEVEAKRPERKNAGAAKPSAPVKAAVPAKVAAPAKSVTPAKSLAPVVADAPAVPVKAVAAKSGAKIPVKAPVAKKTGEPVAVKTAAKVSATPKKTVSAKTPAPSAAKKAAATKAPLKAAVKKSVPPPVAKSKAKPTVKTSAKAAVKGGAKTSVKAPAKVAGKPPAKGAKALGVAVKVAPRKR